jgi:AcrR family transcriptional regulator
MAGEPPQRATYHHGNLREALIAEAIALLEERGTEGFTLRECARRLGVSPTAVLHHFADICGLLTAVAVVGYQRLTASMARARAEAGDSEVEKFRACGGAYLRFARDEPALYRITFGNQVRCDHPEVVEAAEAAYASLTGGLTGVLPGGAAADPASIGTTAILVWSTLHGLATLANDGRLDVVAKKCGLARVEDLERKVDDRLGELLLNSATA